MKFDFNNKLVLVTGSSRGIGLGIAKRFLKLNARVILNSTKKVDLDPLLKNYQKSNAIFFTSDVSCPNQANQLIRDIVDKHGLLNHVVCNVGSGRSVMPGEETYQEWQRMFSLNLWSTTNIIEASKNFFKSDGGSIVCISSICGAEYIPNAPITYSVAKAALNSYVKKKSLEVGKFDILINAILPGAISAYKNNLYEFVKKKENKKRFIKRYLKVNKIGTTDSLMPLLEFLVSKKNNYIIGELIKIDGGER